jgi:hypothetical protein
VAAATVVAASRRTKNRARLAKWVRRPRVRIAKHLVVAGDGVPHSETFPDRARAIHRVEEDTAMAAVESPASEHRLPEGDACCCDGDEAAC